MKKVPIKVKHYGARTININYAIDWEQFITEIFIAFLLAVFAYMGYAGKMPLLLFPCAIGSGVCFFISLRTLYVAIKDRLEAKESAKNET